MRLSPRSLASRISHGRSSGKALDVIFRCGMPEQSYFFENPQFSLGSPQALRLLAWLFLMRCAEYGRLKISTQSKTEDVDISNFGGARDHVYEF